VACVFVDLLPELADTADRRRRTMIYGTMRTRGAVVTKETA
jgi:hypothetical protein